jgi:hypothetical protein
MLQRIMKTVIKGSTNEQLTEMYYEIVKDISLRSAQGMGADETLNELIGEVLAEMSTRTGGGQGLHLPPAA